jgi:hypothetical protein
VAKHMEYYKGEGGGFPNPSHGESCESMFVCDLFVQQRCSNYALTNLLFGLCISMWIIDLLITRPNPILELQHAPLCCNLNFGLTTKAKGLQGCGPRGSMGVTSHTPGSVGKCEGVNPHTPKATPTLGNGVPMDSQNFREQFQGLKLNGL